MTQSFQVSGTSTLNWVTFKQKFIAYSSGVWEFQNEALVNAAFGEDLFVFQSRRVASLLVQKSRECSRSSFIKRVILAWSQWFTPVIPPTQEVEIRSIQDQSQSRQIVCKTLLENPSPEKKKNNNNKVGGMAQSEASEFKSQYCKNNNNNNNSIHKSSILMT
jgi:hypothetical protein